MEKAGMKREGSLQDDVMKDGRYITVELYGIVNPGEAAFGQRSVAA
jgi:hypothetical protein